MNQYKGHRLLSFALAGIVLIAFFTVFVGCKKDNKNPVDSSSYFASCIDIDENNYRTVKIGNQWWTAENLKVTRYRNGDVISNVPDDSTWVHLTTGAYCKHGNNADTAAIYGNLYNWFAVSDSRNIAPTGWHVPTDEEWKTLEKALGMSKYEADKSGWRGTDEGGKMKETGTSHWDSPNTGATNTSGFTALPGAWRNYNDGSFGNLGILATFWSATQYNAIMAHERELLNIDSVMKRFIEYKQYGFSVRLVKD